MAGLCMTKQGIDAEYMTRLDMNGDMYGWDMDACDRHDWACMSGMAWLGMSVLCQPGLGMAGLCMSGIVGICMDGLVCHHANTVYACLG